MALSSLIIILYVYTITPFNLYAFEFPLASCSRYQAVVFQVLTKKRDQKSKWNGFSQPNLLAIWFIGHFPCLADDQWYIYSQLSIYCSVLGLRGGGDVSCFSD